MSKRKCGTIAGKRVLHWRCLAVLPSQSVDPNARLCSGEKKNNLKVKLLEGWSQGCPAIFLRLFLGIPAYIPILSSFKLGFRWLCYKFTRRQNQELFPNTSSRVPEMLH